MEFKKRKVGRPMLAKPNFNEFIDFYNNHTVREVCEKYSVGIGTVYKWVNEFKEEMKDVNQG